MRGLLCLVSPELCPAGEPRDEPRKASPTRSGHQDTPARLPARAQSGPKDTTVPIPVPALGRPRCPSITRRRAAARGWSMAATAK